MRPGSPDERERLHALFAELCAIPSVSGQEAEVAARVRAELAGLGLAVEEDAKGNLLARVPGTGERTVLLCAHMDTVPHRGPIRPVLEEGVWRNAEPDSILGADNKSALAHILLVARRAVAEPPPVGLELLFTVEEETALAGAAQFDVGQLRSEWGYVFDHATPWGEIVLASPTYHRIDAVFRGAAAHAGLRPEKGRSAIVAAAHAIARMELGRLDDETTANVGHIEGGPNATNVVPARCDVAIEARSIDERRVEAVVADIVDRLQDGAAVTECDVDVDVQKLFTGYRTKPAEPAVRAAEAALQSRGFTPGHIHTGGGSDANALMKNGFPCCVNLANGTRANHQPDESVSAQALEAGLDVTLALLDESAAVAV